MTKVVHDTDIGSGLQISGGKLISASSPVGSVIMFAGKTAPLGYLKADGSAVSRATYVELFTAIGTSFGAGDGSTTFNLPDLRGEFLRGWDDGRGVDVGRSFGSNQNDDFKSHSHGTYRSLTTAGSGTYVAAPYTGSDVLQQFGDTIAAGGVETRPRNIALLACIKY